jgi:glucose-6-phosphate 1-dehydrogenase
MANNNKPTIIFIFGGSGDLTYRKLMPALYNLYLDNYLPEKFLIVGIGRTEYTNDAFRDHSKKGIEEHSRRKDQVETKWKEFAPCVEYIKADLEDDASYNGMKERVQKAEKEWNTKSNVIFYLSVAPQLAPTISEKLH